MNGIQKERDGGETGAWELRVNTASQAEEAFDRYRTGQLLYEPCKVSLLGAVRPEDRHGFAVFSNCWVSLDSIQEEAAALPGIGACLEVLGLTEVGGRRWAVLLHRPELPFRAEGGEEIPRRALLRRAEEALAGLSPRARVFREFRVERGLGLDLEEGTFYPVADRPEACMSPVEMLLFREFYGQAFYLRWGEEELLGYGCVDEAGRKAFRAVSGARLLPGRPWLERGPARQEIWPVEALKEARCLPVRRLTGGEALAELEALARAGVRREPEYALRALEELDIARHCVYPDDVRVHLGCYGIKWVTVRWNDGHGTLWGTVVNEPPEGAPFHRGDLVGFIAKREEGHLEWRVVTPDRLSDRVFLPFSMERRRDLYQILCDPGEPRHEEAESLPD